MKTSRLSLLFIVLLLAMPAAGSTVAAYANPGELSVFDHMLLHEFDEAVITTDLAALLGDRQSEPEYQPADLLLTNKEGQMLSWEVELKTRGKYRRRVCDFAPLKLNFSKSQLRSAGLADYDKYKLVTHCEDERYLGETALLKEFATYQMYQALTPNSYRVHLLRVRYVDSKGEHPTVRRYAFLLESTAQLEDRLEMKECEDCLGVGPEQVNREAENIHAVFQYMIGNADFSLTMNRNLKLLGEESGKGGVIPIGYDFDFSGMVSANYAVSAPHLGQTRIGDRVFLGLEADDALIEKTLARFEAKRSELLAIIRQQREMSSQARSEMRAYLTSFFEHLEELRRSGSQPRTYYQLRQTAPNVVPAGADPLHYGVRK